MFSLFFMTKANVHSQKRLQAHRMRQETKTLKTCLKDALTLFINIRVFQEMVVSCTNNN